MNKFFRVQVDCFNQPVEYKTSEVRLRNFFKLAKQLENLDKLVISGYLDFSSLSYLVSIGALSIRSASYFLSGRTTELQNQFLWTFYSFCSRHFGLSVSELFKLWQKQENVVPENTFLFPLAELASKDEDFTIERERYVDNSVLDLKEI